MVAGVSVNSVVVRCYYVVFYCIVVLAVFVCVDGCCLLWVLIWLCCFGAVGGVLSWLHFFCRLIGVVLWLGAMLWLVLRRSLL